MGGDSESFHKHPPLFGRVTDPTGPVTSAQLCHNYTCLLQQAFHSFVVQLTAPSASTGGQNALSYTPFYYGTSYYNHEGAEALAII